MKENKYMNGITQGVYVLGVKVEEKVNFMTAAWLTQISSCPEKILVAVGKTHYTAEMIPQAGEFAVSVLKEGQEELARKYGFSSGKNTDKGIGAKYELAEGIPVLEDVAGYLICKLDRVIEDGDHVLFTGVVTDGKNYGEAPLRYDSESYFK